VPSSKPAPFKPRHMNSSSTSKLDTLIGSLFGAFISGAFYIMLYSTTYPVPGRLFQIPTAHIYLDLGRPAWHMYGVGLAEKSLGFTITSGVFFAGTTAVKIYCRDRRWRGFSPGWCRLRQRSVHCVTAHYPSRTSCTIHPPNCCLESWGGIACWWCQSRLKSGSQSTM
jgi:hypothetical protein